MEVILREDIDNLGRAGEIVKVKDGYGRNYLLPRGLAYPASAGNKRRVAAERQHHDQRRVLAQTEAEQFASVLASVSLTFTAKTGDGDKLFGSVTASDIAEQLAELGHRVDKRVIELPEPIKLIGDYRVPIRLHADVRPEIHVSVRKE